MAVGSSSGRGHRGSQDSYEWEQYGLDPSVAPGLARPRGWRVGLPDGSQAWDKTGPLDTDWTIVGPGGGGVVMLLAGDPAGVPGEPYGITVLNLTDTIKIVGQRVAATWEFGRIYAIDGVNGDDTNTGYQDLGGSTALDYANACQAAGAVAKRTFAGLAEIFPRVGNNRHVEIVIAAGTYAAEITDLISGATGYQSFIVRGTVTDPTAACVAFDGSAADLISSGGVTVTGANGPGYNFVAGTRREISLAKVGGGDPGFLADKTFGGICPFGWRLRFDAATTTAALRNKCFQICKVTGTDTVKFGRTLPVVPAITDTCYVEMAGVQTGQPGSDAFWSSGPCGQLGIQISGVQTSLQWDVNNTQASFCLSGVEALRAGGENGRAENNAGPWLHSGFGLRHPIHGAVTVGGGLRVMTSADLSYGAYNLYGFIANDETTISDPTELVFADGCSAYNLDITASLGNPNNSSFITPNIGTDYNAGIPFSDNDPTPPRFYGQNISDGTIRIRGGSGSLGRLSVDGADDTAAGQSCIAFFDIAKWVITAPLEGTIGNTGHGMTFNGAAGAEIEIQAVPTMTGALGDILLAGQQVATYAHLVTEEIYDTAFNHIFRATIELGEFYAHTIDPSALTGVVIGASVAEYALVRVTAAGLVELAQANTESALSGLLGVAVNAGAAGSKVLVSGLSGLKVLNFDAAAPMPGLPVYVSPTVAGAATVTTPTATQQTLAIGVVAKAVSGSMAVVAIAPQPAGAPTVANWSSSNIRVYAIDPINGNDASRGYADAAGTSAGQYATACAAAGAVAKRTIAGLTAIFPKVGAGRTVEIVIANGGVNTQGAFAETLGQLLNGVNGYALAGPLVRGTGTNTTAGCVAFDGSTADVTYQGAITVPTLNVAGYNPVGATTTSLPCQLAGGGAAALPAEPASPLGWRVRFDAATVTVALRNQCRQIAQVAGGNTITPQTAFGAAPAAGDVFYIEQAGIAITVADLISGLGYATPTNVTIGVFGAQITGVRWNTTINFSSLEIRMALCGGAAFNVSGDSALINLGQTLAHPVLGSFTIGGGFRAETGNTSFSTNGLSRLGSTGLVIAAGGFTATNLVNFAWSNGSYVAAALTWSNCSFPVSLSSVTGSPQIGSAASPVRSPRATRLIASNVKGTIGECVFAGAGASPAITVNGCCQIAFATGVCSGTTGNNDVGLDLTAARGCLIILATTPTVTGALGDIRLAGGQIITWAQAIATGIIDSAGNQIIGTAGTPPLAPLKFTGSLFGGAGAALSYCADTSPALLLANEALAVRYPISQRLFTRLRVATLALTTNTIPNTVTLYKNGVPTTMVVPIPAATAAFTKAVDLAHPILFADGDDLALVLANAGADVGAVTEIAATLEGPV